MRKRTLRDVFLLIFDTLCQWVLRRQGKHTDRILIIRLDGIGDFVLWLDAAKAIREKYADRHITLAASAVWYDLARGLPYFDEVIPVKRRKLEVDLLYRYKTFKRIRQVTYHTALQPLYTRVRRFRDGEAILRLVRAKRKIGSAGEDVLGWRKRLCDRWYTDFIPATGAPLTELERNAEFMRGLGFPRFRAEVPTLPRQHLPDVPADVPQDYYILFLGAGSPLRHWPPSRFAELARRIFQATGWVGILCGGPGEEALGNELVERAPGIPLQNRVGATSLPELAALIAKARFLVGNETGAVHIAAAVSTPSVCILGGGHYGRFVPYTVEQGTEAFCPVPVTYPMACFNCDWACLYDPAPDQAAPCVAQISVDAVWEKVASVIERLARPRSNVISSS